MRRGWTKKTALYLFMKFPIAGITAQKTKLFGISSSIWFWRGIGYNKILQAAVCRLSACRLPFAQSEIIQTRWISISKIVTWFCLRRRHCFFDKTPGTVQLSVPGVLRFIFNPMCQSHYPPDRIPRTDLPQKACHPRSNRSGYPDTFWRRRPDPHCNRWNGQ